jgi:hypothetical protein
LIRTVLFFLFIFTVSLSIAQDERYGLIRVEVLDGDKNKPIPFASVYLNNTTIGGIADENGEIEIKKIPFGPHEIVFSSVGYKSATQKINVNRETPIYITVKLGAQDVLQEVRVVAKTDLRWQRQYERFKKLFFGNEHESQCTIINPWVLDFKTYGNFSAEASEPLKIVNNFLGYNLTFDMKSCVFATSSFLIAGHAKFQEQETTDLDVKQRWLQNRESVYRGSMAHFFRSVINNNLKDDGYEIYSDMTLGEQINRSAYFLRNFGMILTNITFESHLKQDLGGGMYQIRIPSRLEIHYKKRRAPSNVYVNIAHALSWMEVKNKNLLVNKDGQVQNPKALTLMGNMSQQRVADWLPINFKSSDLAPLDPIIPVPYNDALLEKPYVQTDREYYYKGETMWLKGYMSYLRPLLRDSLSKAVYVDVIDSAGYVKTSKMYPVKDGTFQGDVFFDKSLKPGPYQLKAYTRWMMNFDQGLIFTKTINILDDKQAVRMISSYNPVNDTTGAVKIRTDKEVYGPRDKIDVSIDVLDSLEFSTLSDISVSVTDVEQAVPHLKEENIVKSYLFTPAEKAIAKDSIMNVRFNIEYGVDFKGAFKVGRKPMQGILTVYQRDVNEAFGIITDEMGHFGELMSFMDSAKFYIDARGVNKKKGKVVMDYVGRPPAPPIDFDTVKLDIYTSEKNQSHIRIDTSTTKILQQVIVKASKIEKALPAAMVHPKGDYFVTGDWIEENNIMDAWTALQRKIPGVRELDNGKIRVIASANYGPGDSKEAGDPLILVDGVPYPDVTVKALNDIPIRSIERIDVLKYGSTASFGSRGSNGVIAIYTKRGKPTDEKTAKNFSVEKLQQVVLTGFSSTTSFEPVDYSADGENGYFDYRSTLLWKPDLKTDGKKPASVSFYAADATTKYRIVVEGVTKDGAPVHGEKVISIVSGK